MLALHGSLLDIEGRHASDDELGLAHSPEYLGRVRGWVEQAEQLGRVIEPEPGIRVSAASWDASTAAVGCALTAVDLVVRHEAQNAFCAIRPSGQYAGPDHPGQFGLLNPVAVAARYLVITKAVRPVLVVEWGGAEATATQAIAEAWTDVEVVGVYARDVLRGGQASGEGYVDVLERRLEQTAVRSEPACILLSADFSGMRGDPVGDLSLTAQDYYDATIRLRGMADRWCGGQLVSILGGGYLPEGLGEATVQHLRALTGLPAAPPS